MDIKRRKHIRNKVQYYAFLFLLVIVLPNSIWAQNNKQNRTESIENQNTEFIDKFQQFESNREFQEFNSGFENSEGSCNNLYSECSLEKSSKNLFWVLGILFFTIIAGFLVRFKSARSLRGLTLLVALVILGFYRGGCPCPIMSMQNLIMAGIGLKIKWHSIIWFLGLIPITYFLGRVWCGWVCHLGALQELLFLPGKVKILQSEKAQKTMRIIRVILLTILIFQIIITKTNLLKEIDPFKVAFNFKSANNIGWILLVMLLLSSIFIYRPFCKTVCPVGLVLGWVSKIPGALILSPKSSCIGCNICNKSCKINAITCDDKNSKLDNQECIACGNCKTDCKKNSISFVRNIGPYSSKSVCEKD